MENDRLPVTDIVYFGCEPWTPAQDRGVTRVQNPVTGRWTFEKGMRRHAVKSCRKTPVNCAVCRNGASLQTRRCDGQAFDYCECCGRASNIRMVHVPSHAKQTAGERAQAARQATPMTRRQKRRVKVGVNPS